jgi:hypothetical protein
VNKKIAIGVLVGLVIGLVLGIFVSVLFNLPSSFHTGVGVSNQVQVSGTVSDRTTGTLCFRNLDKTIETTAPITNGKYSVLLVGGQSYNVYYDFVPSSSYDPSGEYNAFYVPLGVTTFTENLVRAF